MRNIFLYFVLLFLLFACTNNTIQTKDHFQDTVASLPFFNHPDWTPEWINTSDSQYKKIHTIPAFSFMDQNANVITEQTVGGKIYVANFFFTKCRSICPKMTSNMYLLQEAFKMDSTILFLSHSVTPQSDSVSVLQQYAIQNKVNPKQWHLLTGAQKDIYALAKQQYFAGDTVGYYQSGDEFLHTENFILIDKHRRIRGVYNGTLLVEIDRIKEDINILKKEE
jgi:protein SCO1/2